MGKEEERQAALALTILKTLQAKTELFEKQIENLKNQINVINFNILAITYVPEVQKGLGEALEKASNDIKGTGKKMTKKEYKEQIIKTEGIEPTEEELDRRYGLLDKLEESADKVTKKGKG